MQFAKQLSALPTNKLLTGVIGAPMFSAAWSEIFSQAYPPLAGDGVATLAGTLLALALGYFIPDRVNLPK